MRRPRSLTRKASREILLCGRVAVPYLHGYPTNGGTIMTTFKALTIAAALTLTPGLALAMCSGAKHQQAQSCATGTSWDAGTQSCQPIASS